MKLTHRMDSDLDKQVIYYKERTEVIYIALIAALLIFLFNPISVERAISKETKVVLYLFGFMLLISAKWGIFVQETKTFKRFQSVV